MKNNKKILAAVLLTALTATWVTFASNQDVTSTWNTQKEQRFFKKWFDFNDRKWAWFWFQELTQEEKTSLETMTSEEKKAFFESKMTQMQEKRELHEKVIDKLLNKETLTSQEEEIRQEIITQRAENKAKRLEMEEYRSIMEKQKSNETLTSEEQAKLEEFKQNFPNNWKWFWKWKHKGFNR